MRLPLTLFCFSATFIFASAQPYNFSQTTAAYTDLSGATTVTTSAPWTYASSFPVPIGFTFDFMGVNYNTINVEGSGFTFFDVNYYYLLLPYGVKLQSKGSSGGNSPISYKLEGAMPNRILKVQWKNAGFYYDTTQTTNFQLWLYETSNRIEMRAGPSSIANAALVFQENASPGPVVGVYEWSSWSTCSYGLTISGNPASASSQQVSGAVDIFTISLSAPPATGTVYIFDPSANGVQENETAFSFNVFPSPADEQFTIVCSHSEKNFTYELATMQGEIAASGNCGGETNIRTSALAAGIYTLHMTCGEMRQARKLLIMH